MHPIVEQMIAAGHCICGRGLSVDPRCPIHKHEATFAERRRYGLIPMDPQHQRELDAARGVAGWQAQSNGERFYAALRKADPLEFPDEWGDLTPTWRERMEFAARSYGVAAGAKAQEFFCNKCGYFGPVEVFHERPNGSGKCDYMAVPVKTASGVSGLDGGQR